ncbi:Fur family transcriptional regulator [Corynebacterium sp.]|uniref:Fur family transcriptional regulator n=1 Tax=Corynebacterium sp. TaxID=1720 RepID=UPI0026DBE544|nr:Fur family transcriptional regulator [Corynebacterium sp.]MDO4610860.1 Fur family transcriptional regulator [Corynebacterium sp.]
MAEAGARRGSTPRIGVRTTKQRTAVLETLQKLNNFMSARDIHRRLQDDGASVGLTTVYRTLQSLTEMKAVDVLHTDGGEALYRLCSDHHHHHLVCTDCGATVEISGGPVEKWADELAGRHGYTMTGHSAEIFGVCSDCRHEGGGPDGGATD